jgi:hypothetical protein
MLLIERENENKLIDVDLEADANPTSLKPFWYCGWTYREFEREIDEREKERNDDLFS